MAPSFYLTLLLSLMLTILFISPADSHYTLSEKVLHDICSKHKHSPVCLKALQSYPITPLAHVIGLTKISINQAAVAANKTIELMALLKRKTMVPSYVAQYEICHEMYVNIIDQTEDAKKALKAGDYEKVFVAAARILTYNADCSDELGSPDSVPLQGMNKKVYNYYFTTLLRVSNSLTKYV
ncbi:pectinesterase inhibitor-like [Quercus lobata]|uniref:Pectinesterase inhibitor domain-containing protein n=1 Tax=Quercus lobata TaxID=97700 RepID=A0A7N2LC72_QUELO|nr:pectinesterase inhibitor-like [Quercus lobata]